MRLAAILVTALAASGCASAAFPQDKGKEWYAGTPTGRADLDRVGPYIGLSLIQGMEDFDTQGSAIDTEDSDVGLGIKGGLRVQPNLAVELAIESLGGFEVTPPGAEIDIDFVNIVVQGKFFMLQGPVQPYILAGFGYVQAELDASTPFVPGGFSDDESGSLFRVGGGADVYVTPAMAVFGEVHYNLLGGDLKDLDHFDIALGLLFRF
ncbi:MAG TPA: porin family protein [Planctomycetota bacterium]|nr:porin family protein [Planctomycetota bacterium]